MFFRSADPVTDAIRAAAEADAENEKYPICDCCGDRITDETFQETVYKGKILKLHNTCIYNQYTSDYIEEKGFFQSCLCPY